MSKSPVIVAMDYSDSKSALQMADQLDPALCRVKIGKELFTRTGPALVGDLVGRGFDVFLDLKFHDIPNTVAAAVAAAADLGVWMVNVHASGGPKMMAAARAALNSFGNNSPLLTAVTVLTSMGADELSQTGVIDAPDIQVRRLAHLAKDSGMDGVVCSSWEARELAATLGGGFVLVTPGIRLTGASSDDQTRIATPLQAINEGSHYLVIGRPITRSENPIATLRTIIEEIT